MHIGLHVYWAETKKSTTLPLDYAETFTFPDFSDNTVIINAVFSDLINIYHMEKESILKDVYKLTWKCLFPNNIDR